MFVPQLNEESDNNNFKRKNNKHCLVTREQLLRQCFIVKKRDFTLFNWLTQDAGLKLARRSLWLSLS